jgi:16S rRNA (adenine1518-N6/adenine1519-N6)-dimethyltransferase
MLRQSLRSIFGDAERVLTELGILPTARAEELTVEQFCVLARHLQKGRPPASSSV